ncbi:MAG: PAS domain S-box protein [Gloeomargarita sp. HHBFW_bins_162]
MNPPFAIDPDCFSLLVDAPDGMVITDDQGRWVWVNETTTSLLGRPRQELLGKTGAELIPGWPPQSTPSTLETFCPCPDGTLKHLIIDYIALELNIIPQHHLFVINQPVTKNINEVYYRTLFNLLPVGVSITDREGNLIECNPAATEILGISARKHRQRQIDSSAWRILRPDGTPMPSEEYASVQALRHNRSVTGQIQQVVRPDGSTRWLSVNAAPLPNEQGVVITYIDITEQREAEAARQKMEQQLNQIAEASPAVIYSMIQAVDDSVHFEYLSPIFSEIHEISVAEAYENPHLVHEQFHPDDRLGYRKAVAKALKHGRPFHHTWRIITPSGKVKWLQVNSRAERLENGEVRWRGVALDITKQKELERSLERKIAQEQALNQVVQAIRSSLDLTEIFTIAATTISQQFNLETSIVKYLLEQSCWQYQIRCLPTRELDTPTIEIPDQDNPFAQALKNNQIVHVDDSQTITDPINQKIAQQFPGAWLLVPIQVENQVWGSLTLMRSANSSPWQADEVSLARRVSEHLGIAIQQAEIYQKLQASQQELCLILDNSPAAIIQWCLCPDYQVKYEYISPQNETVFGYSAQSLFDDPDVWKRYMLPEDWENIVIPALDSIYRGTDHISIYYRSQHPQRGLIWVHETIAVQSRHDPDSIGLISVVVDVTDWKSAQIQIEELSRLNRMKDDFISTVSHELRTPLTNIQMATRMLELTLKRQGLLTDDNQTSLHQYFYILKDQTQREVNLVNDLLDLARLESGVRCPTCIPIDLQTFVPPLLEPFAERTKQQQQTLLVELPDDLPPGFAHPPYLERIISELVGNACKYTPAGEKIIISGGAQGEQVWINVINTGVEIPPSEQTRIFEKFYRIPTNDPWQYGGTGLGLALVKELVERMEGVITLTSGAGQTCFRVILRRIRPVDPS